MSISPKKASIAARSLGVVFALVGASAASAAPGDHIKAGDALITPQIDLGVEYRTNAYQVSDPNFTIPVTNLRVAPGLSISANTPQTEFRLNGISELRYVVSTNGRYGEVDGQDIRVNLDRFNDFNVSSGLRLMKGAPLSFNLSENIGLRNNPAQAANAVGSGSAYHSQLRNDLRGAAVLRAGPGVDATLTGMWAWDNFLVAGNSANGYRGFNRRHTVGPVLEGKWTFFPRTALVGDIGYYRHIWAQNIIDTPQGPNYAGEDLGETLVLADSHFVKARVGLRGRITPKLVLIGTVGYGDAWYFADTASLTGADGDSWEANPTALQGLLSTVQAKYELAPGNRVTAGYQKDFEDSWFTNYMAYNSLYVTLENRFGPRFGTNLSFDTRFESYQGEVSRNDVLVRAKGDLSYSIMDFASVSTGVWWTRRVSPTRPLMEYDDVNVHALLNFTY